MPSLRADEPSWWDDLFPNVPFKKPPGSNEMLYLIAYDIADPKRLHRVATICEDYGLRVQNSLFECWLDERQFASLWTRLRETIVVSVDRIAAYVLDKNASGKRVVAGETMKSTQQAYCFVA